MKERDDVAVRVSHVSKEFRLPNDSQNSLKGRIINFNKRGYSIQHALKDVSFEIKKGEFFGIVGRNGSGKSTLLKLISGIYHPTKGDIRVNGKLTPFIELGVGFNPELSGRDNVFLNGALLGFSRSEMSAMYDEIVGFAELERFMDQKLKNYSSGMQVRLAFSIAIRANTDILVLDEVLAVGDEAFQKKCFEYFSQIKKNKKTVILVTHSMDAVQRFCDRALIIDKGCKVGVGRPLETAQIYRELNDQDSITVNKDSDKSDGGTKYISAKVSLKKRNNELEFNVTIKPKQDLEDPIVALEIFRDNGEQVIRWVTDEKLDTSIKLSANKNLTLNITLQDIFPTGVFSVRLLVRRRDRALDYGVFNDIAKFEIKNKTSHEYNILWKPHEKFSLEVGDE